MKVTASKNDATDGGEFDLRFLLGCLEQILNESDRRTCDVSAPDKLRRTKDIATAAVRHRVVPLVAHALKSDNSAALSEVVELRRQHQYCVVAGMLMKAELIRIAEAFSASGIPLLALKGPILERQVYPEHLHRQYRDLDLLIRPDDLSLGCTLLRELGYDGQVAKVCDSSAASLRSLTRHHKHVHGIRHVGASAVVVELHWKLGGTARMSAAWDEHLWKEPARVLLGRTDILSLQPEQLIVFLAIHGGRHRWKRLLWLCDFAFAVRQLPDSRWSQVFNFADELRLAPYLNLAFTLCRQLLPEFRLPDPVSHRTAASAIAPDVAASCLHAMKADELYYENQPLSGVKWYFQMEHCAEDRLQALASVLSPKDDDILCQGVWRSRFRRVQYMASRTLSLLGYRSGEFE